MGNYYKHHDQTKLQRSIATPDIERRIASLTVNLRAAGSADAKVIEGTAASYNTLSGPIPTGKGSFRERIMPGAFKNVLASKPDVTMLQDHDPSKILGRTTSGTLTLRDSSAGLQFRCTLPNTSVANDLHESIKRGDINSCSFAFTLGERDADFDDVDEDDLDDLSNLDFDNGRSFKKTMKKPVVVRTIRNVAKLHDVSVVTYPAYPNGTSVQARSRSNALVIPSATDTLVANIARLEKELDEDKNVIQPRRRQLLAQILS